MIESRKIIFNPEALSPKDDLIPIEQNTFRKRLIPEITDHLLLIRKTASVISDSKRRFSQLNHLYNIFPAH